MLQVQVPAGVSEGMTFHIQVQAPAAAPVAVAAVAAAAPQPTTMQVQCPAGAGPGSTIQIQDPSGQMLQVQVPAGVSEGMTFEIQVGGAAPQQTANPMMAGGAVMAGGAAMAGGAVMMAQPGGGVPGGGMNMAGMTGADRLAPFGDLFIKQQIDMLEAFTGFEEGNKYDIFGFVPGQGQTHIMRAGEDSDCCSRQCGPAHAFELKIFEFAQQPIFNIERPWRCQPPHCCCMLQELTVWDGNGNSDNPTKMLGQVLMNYAPCGSNFDIVVDGTTCYKIEGPICICDGPCCGDQVFNITDPSGQPVAAPGSVCGQAEIRKLGGEGFADAIQQQFTDADNFGCTFPPAATPAQKSIILSAVFLLDFLFFENNAPANDNSGGGYDDY
eukprot:SAG22_NODE_149_length_17456_cov_5.058363_4_plen_383_part_00